MSFTVRCPGYSGGVGAALHATLMKKADLTELVARAVAASVALGAAVVLAATIVRVLDRRWLDPVAQ